MKRDLESLVSTLVLKSGSRKVADLAKELDVSEVTIRKTLSALEKRGVVQRFHGEARAYDGDDIPFRMGSRYDDKLRIARRAAEFVERGDTILLEAGSTVAILAGMLKELRDLTVITTNLFIARLFRGTKVTVVVLGGVYQGESESLIGPQVRAALDATAFSKAFLGVTGFTQVTGFTLNDYHRAEITQAILAKGATSFVLTDSGKFGILHAAKIASGGVPPQWIITDPGIPPADEAFLETAGSRILKV